jgi:Zn-dependent M28 family amino/carboxypeptidase/peroxiredoxin
MGATAGWLALAAIFGAVGLCGADGPEVGRPAPSVEFRDEKNAVVTLESFKGRRVLLAFYPKDFSPGCTAELERLRDRRDEFDARSISIVAISLDGTDSHAKFGAALKLPFPLLADPGGAASKAFGVYSDEFGGISRRSVFLLDAKGVVTYADPKYDLRTEADWDALLAALGPRPSGSGLFSADDYRHDLQTLASDEFEGRGIGAKGEEKSVAFLSAQLAAAGFKPAVNGTYEQPVALLKSKMTRPAELSVGGKELTALDDFVVFTHRQQASVAVKDAPLLFVGYGCTAPEYRWDDFKGVDCKGKVLLMLVNDPPLADGRFGGPAMTYYGRWTYKFEEAARRGAAGVLLVHETEAAAYPWEVVRTSWGSDNFDLKRDDLGASRCSFEAWIQRDVAADLVKRAGRDFGALKAAAATEEFKPVALSLPVSCAIEQTLTPQSSRNVVGILPGSDEQGRARTVAEALRSDEFLILCAHWDHLGRDDSLEGDAIFNGAVDNASGCCGILALARALAKSPVHPKRSTLALFVTGEERGLLGSQWYCDHPLVPIARTVAMINLDGMNVLGRTRDLAVIGMGQSTLEELLADAVEGQKRKLVPDPMPEQGRFFRSDQLSFARKGIPGLYISGGIDFVDRPEGWGLAQSKRYTAELYHKVKDEFDPNWNYDGTIDDLAALLSVAQHVLNDATVPSWRESSEFRALRAAPAAPPGR